MSLYTLIHIQTKAKPSINYPIDLIVWMYARYR
jgi:hypothetical protein